MSNEYLEISLQSLDDRAKYSARSRQNPELIIDYFPPVGNGEGYTSLELLMISLTSCISTVLITLLRTKMGRTVSGVEAKAKGTVKEDHPKALSHIQIDLTVKSDDVSEAEIKRALAVSEEKLCPVWSMLKGNVEVNVSFVIQKD